MFNKIIKRGHRKGSKSVSNETFVTVNHSSVANFESQPPILSPLPQPSPIIPKYEIQNLPKFNDVPSSEKLNLFIKKTQLCCVLCDFNDPSKMTREKEIKHRNLQELVKFIQSDSSKINEQMQENLMRMISINIFRALPPAFHENTGSLPDVGEPDEEDAWLEPAWPHLQLVYEILLRYIVSNGADKKIAKRYIDHTFVLKLLDLFDTEDHREREYLKMVLHRIYGRFMSHRPFIRAGINNVFYRFIFETERHNGIGELLEILGSIINGFALPMKEEHKLFLVRAMLPLHKPKCVALYHQQLTYCVVQFVEKDYELADTVIRGLLRYWPVTNCQKEVLFLGELEEVLDVTHPAEFQQCMGPLFRQIGRCLTSPHFQVHIILTSLIYMSCYCSAVSLAGLSCTHVTL